MKAIVNTTYGSPDILQFKEVEKPAPAENEVLIKVHAASVNSADWHFMRGDPILVRLGLIRSLGADKVIDYTQEDFTQNGQHYDLILGANGYRSISDYKRALSPTGTYVMTGGSGGQLIQAMFLGPWMSKKEGQKMGSLGESRPNQKDLMFLSTLLESGKIVPAIDRRYPLREAAEGI